MFYAVAQTVALGRRAGWYSALGFHIGGFVHILAAAFGLAVLLQTVPQMFTVVKLAGAAYLIWLGIKYIRRAENSKRSIVAAQTKTLREKKTSGRALLDSIVVEMLNPKSALFFIAFLPQFTDSAASFPIWGQIVVLGAFVNAVFTASDAVCIELSDAAMKRVRGSPGLVRLAERAGGGILITLGLHLAAARQ